MNEEAELAVIEYVSRRFPSPKRTYPKNRFEEQLYSHWAATEILRLIADNPFTSPEYVVDEYLIKITYFSCLARHEETKKMFNILIETAQDILTFIIDDC